MDSARLKSPYSTRLPIIKTAKARPPALPRMLSMAPDSLSKALDNIVSRPQPTQTMDVDYPSQRVETPISSEGVEPNNVRTNRLIGTLQCKTLMRSDMDIVSDHEDSKRIDQNTLSTQDDVKLDDFDSFGTTEANFGASFCALPTLNKGDACGPISGQAEGRLVLDPCQQERLEHETSDEKRKFDISLDEVMRNSVSDRPVSQTKTRCAAEHMHETLKNAIGSILTRRTKFSTVGQKTVVPPKLTSSDPGPSSAQQKDSAPQSNTKEGILPGQLRRSLSKVAGLVALNVTNNLRGNLDRRFQLRTFKKNKRHMLQTKSLTTANPQLAASLDAMALNYAKDCKNLLADTPSFINLAGKRHHDSDCAIQSYYQSSSSHERTCGSAKSLMQIDQAHYNTAHMKTGNPQKKADPMISNMACKPFKTSHGATDVKSGNTLDFLASIMLQQETERMQHGNQTDHREMNVKDQREMNEKSGDQVEPRTMLRNPGVQRDSDLRSVSGAEIMPPSYIVGDAIPEIMASRENTGAFQDKSQSYLHVQKIQPDKRTPLETTVRNTSATHLGNHLPEVGENGEEPKSESSLICEGTAIAKQKDTRCNLSYSVIPLPTKNISQETKDESSPFPGILTAPKTCECGQATPIPTSMRVQKEKETERIGDDYAETENETIIAPFLVHEDTEVGSGDSQTNNTEKPGSNVQGGPTRILPFVEENSAKTARDIAQTMNPLGGDAIRVDTEVRKLAARKHVTSLGSKRDSTSKLPKPKRDGRGRRRGWRAMVEGRDGTASVSPRRPKHVTSLPKPISHVNQSPGRDRGTRKATSSKAGESSDSNKALPYEFCCETCGATFNRKFNLNKHIRNVHHNIRNFECTLCDERFLQKSHLAAHLLAVHHKLRPFRCQLCSKTFTWHGVLRKHLQAIHNITIKSNSKTTRCSRPKYDGQQCVVPNEVSHSPSTPADIAKLPATPMETLCLAAKSAESSYRTVTPEVASHTPSACERFTTPRTSHEGDVRHSVMKEIPHVANELASALIDENFQSGRSHNQKP